MVVEAVDLIVVGYIVEAGHIADIEEMKELLRILQQEKMIDIAVEEKDFVGLVLLAVADSSVLCKLAIHQKREYTTRTDISDGDNISRPKAPL